MTCSQLFNSHLFCLCLLVCNECYTCRPNRKLPPIGTLKLLTGVSPCFLCPFDRPQLCHEFLFCRWSWLLTCLELLRYKLSRPNRKLPPIKALKLVIGMSTSLIGHSYATSLFYRWPWVVDMSWIPTWPPISRLLIMLTFLLIMPSHQCMRKRNGHGSLDDNTTSEYLYCYMSMSPNDYSHLSNDVLGNATLNE